MLFALMLFGSYVIHSHVDFIEMKQTSVGYLYAGSFASGMAVNHGKFSEIHAEDITLLW